METSSGISLRGDRLLGERVALPLGSLLGAIISLGLCDAYISRMLNNDDDGNSKLKPLTRICKREHLITCANDKIRVRTITKLDRGGDENIELLLDCTNETCEGSRDASDGVMSLISEFC